MHRGAAQMMEFLRDHRTQQCMFAFVGVRAHTRVCTDTHTDRQTHVHTRLTFLRDHCTQQCMFAFMRVRAHTRMCTDTHTDRHTHTLDLYIYMCIYIYIYICIKCARMKVIGMPLWGAGEKSAKQKVILGDCPRGCGCLFLISLWCPRGTSSWNIDKIQCELSVEIKPSKEGYILHTFINLIREVWAGSGVKNELDREWF